MCLGGVWNDGAECLSVGASPFIPHEVCAPHRGLGDEASRLQGSAKIVEYSLAKGLEEDTARTSCILCLRISVIHLWLRGIISVFF